MNPPNPPLVVQYGNPPRTRQTRQEQVGSRFYRTTNKEDIKGDLKETLGTRRIHRGQSD